jgi:hypothetical protein
MPRQKNFKKLVRARAARTGESYTAARAHFVPQRPQSDPDAGALTRALAAMGVVDPRTGTAYTEPLVFGVGGGIGFQYLVFAYEGWTSVAIEARRNTLYFEKASFVEHAATRLGVGVTVQRLPSPATAEKRLRAALAKAPEVVLTLDLARLPGHVVDGPYLPHPVTVAQQGDALVVTGLPGGRVTMPWPELLDARWTNASKYGGLHLLTPGDPGDLRATVRAAIARTAACLLAPSRTSFDGGFGIPGMRRWARLLTDPKDAKGWPTLFEGNHAAALESVRRGLARGASRPLYAAFLTEAARILDDSSLADAATAYDELGRRWSALAGHTPDELADALPGLADAEEEAARSLT